MERMGECGIRRLGLGKLLFARGLIWLDAGREGTLGISSAAALPSEGEGKTDSRYVTHGQRTVEHYLQEVGSMRSGSSCRMLLLSVLTEQGGRLSGRPVPAMALLTVGIVSSHAHCHRNCSVWKDESMTPSVRLLGRDLSCIESAQRPS